MPHVELETRGLRLLTVVVIDQALCQFKNDIFNVQTSNQMARKDMYMKQVHFEVYRSYNARRKNIYIYIIKYIHDLFPKTPNYSKYV